MSERIHEHRTPRYRRADKNGCHDGYPSAVSVLRIDVRRARHVSV